MKVSYPVAMFALVVAISVGIGMGVSIGERSKTGAANVQCPEVQVLAPQAATRSDGDIKNAKIVDAVQRFAVYNGDFDNGQYDKPKNADQAGDSAQWFYKDAEKYADLRKFVDTNQLSGNTIGFSSKDIRVRQIMALKRTLSYVLMTRRFGSTNRCLWEGGCFTRDEINGTIKGLRDEINDL